MDPKLVVAGLGLLLALSLEGCDEPQTCWPNSAHMDTGEYSCVSNRYCSRQDFATVLSNAMSLEECMQECKNRNCAVIQYDCGTHCWLLDSCGDHVNSGCESSIYYRDVNWAAATTTTSTRTTDPSFGSCYLGTAVNPAFDCTPAKYCTNQALADQSMATLSLSSCLDLCESNPSCSGVQYDCNAACWLLLDVECGAKVDSVCGSSTYIKTATTTYQPSFTTGPTSGFGVCFPGTLDSGGYTCTEATYCSGQSGADQSMRALSLPECMVECDSRPGCTGIQYDCNTECWLLDGVSCGTEISSQCGSSVYYKLSTGTVSLPLTQAPTTSTSGLPQGGGNCFFFGSSGDNGNYACEPQVYCSNQVDALQLGPMSLQQCMIQCDRYSCGAIQFDCNSDCWLLRSCESYVASQCGSSVYFPKPDGWPATTTTTTVFGACFPSSDELYVFNDYTCRPAVYCSNQADATNYGAMTINQCAELCRHISGCRTIQYDCNTECWLLTTDCASELVSQCGSSVYSASSGTMTGGFYGLRDGHTWISYSGTTCAFDDCVVTANCPAGSWPIECQTIPPNKGDGAVMNGQACEAHNDGSGDPIVAQAKCSDLFETHVESTERIETGTLSLGCSNGSAVSCNCHSPWKVPDQCAGTSTFDPIVSGSTTRCELTKNGDGGASISAVCAKGRFSEAYLWSKAPLAEAADSEKVPTYCGWTYDPTITSNGPDEVDCSSWLSIPDITRPGGCHKNECLDLADCVKICNLCGACNGVLFDPVHGGSELIPAMRCIMQGSLLGSPSLTDYLRGEDYQVYVGGIYVNSRHSSCQRAPAIHRVTLFDDTGCSSMVQPQGIVENPSRWSISSSWTHAYDYSPACVPSCDHDLSFFKVVFSQPTSVMCAVVHSTEDFAKGWSIRVDPNLLIDFNTPDPTLASLVAESSYGGAVAFKGSPNVAEDTEVKLTGALQMVCQGADTSAAEAAKCHYGDGRYLTSLLCFALAQLLAIPQHMVHLTFNMRRLQEDRQRRLQYPSAYYMDYVVEIKILADRPHAAALANSVLAQLQDMSTRLSILDNRLASLVTLDITLSANVLGGFTRAETAPATSELPIPTTTALAPTMAPTTQAVVVPQPEVVQDDSGVIAGSLVGTAVFLIFGIICCLNRKFICSTCCKSRPTAARGGGAVHPTTGVAGGPPVTSSGPSAVVVSGKALVKTHSKELFQPLTIDAFNSLPGYWTGPKFGGEVDYHAASREDLSFDELMYVSHKNMRYFQDLVTHTYKPIPTQDRLCPTGAHGKTRGGCPCVQVDGSPGLPTDFQVKRVIRVEDSEMFSRYIMKRDKIRMNRVDKTGKSCEAPDPAFFTRDWMEWHKETNVLCDLDDEINEVYLWHGTQVRVGLQIAQEDFKLTFAGSGAGTMYGKGLYFTESATKADEYAKDEPGGHYDNIRALLLCRICVGQFYYTQDREPTAIDKYTAGEADSTLGDRAKAVNTYREIVVYDADQVYPEYLVIYERVHGGKASTPREDLPFLLELPLYWKNVGRNPYEQGFREHWVVKHKIKDLIQRLAEGTCRQNVQVQKVRRVEDSALWCRYINYKRNLAKEIEDSGTEIKQPNELDGNPESGHVLTEKILKENHGDEAISVETMQMGLNEMLLWHGTSKHAAETIAEEGFLVASAAHGRRFGNGVYLAEDLTKSLDYCKQSDGILYVLLCRATCGHIYYTEKDWDSGADKPAKAQGCSCVLANPNQRGPREYILFDVGQVYPEYIVELKRE